MHSLLETYLTRLESNLKPLPKNRRADEVREMRSHLMSAFERHKESGQDEAIASQMAVDDFGAPEVIARQTVVAWRRSGDTSLGALIGVIGFSYLVVSFANYWLIYTSINFIESRNITSFPTLVLDHSWTPYLVYRAVVVPLFAATIVGVVFPKKAVFGLAWALLFASVGSIFSMLLTLLFSSYRPHSGQFDWLQILSYTLVFGLMQYPVALLWAGFVGRWREKRLQLAG
jgi:hypothetical protein